MFFVHACHACCHASVRCPDKPAVCCDAAAVREASSARRTTLLSVRSGAFPRRLIPNDASKNVPYVGCVAAISGNTLRCSVVMAASACRHCAHRCSNGASASTSATTPTSVVT
eukprot:2166170-Prymnesium_polylepis.2